MKITNISIKNVFQHGSLGIPVSGHLTGLVGPNGSGKSNLLKCIQFAFSGEVPGKNKEQLLKWGEKSGAVTVEFVHQGQSGKITRATGQGKTSLEYNGETYAGITKVNQAVDALLGMDKDVARTVFVAQAELDTVLFETPAKREQAFQKMCGIGEADKVYRDLGPWITSKMPPVFDTSAQIATGREELSSLQKIKQELDAEDKQVSSELQNLDLESLRVEQQIFTDIKNHCTTINTLSEDLAARAARESAVQQQRTAAASQIEGIDFEKLDAKLSTARTALTSAEEYASLLATASAEAAALDALEECPVRAEDIELAQKAYDTAKAAASELQGISRLYEGLLKAMQEAGSEINECPVCGSQISDKKSVTARLQDMLTKASVDVNKLDVAGKHLAAENAVRERTVWGSRKQNLENRLSVAQSALNTKQAPVNTPDAMREELTKMEAVARSLQQIRIDVAGFDAQIAAERKELERCRSQVDTARERLKSLGCDGPDYHVELRSACDSLIANGTRINRCTELLQQQASIRGRLAEITARITALAQGIEKLVRQNAQNADYEQVKATLEQVRNWVHYSNGPHKMAVRVMESLTDAVNMFLTRLNAPFYVVLTEDGMSYQCPFTDGRTMPESGAPEASELSGGQKTMLALAFRLASYCMFASQQGLLTLDEPSAYLDSENVSNFCTLLERLKEIMVQLDLQIFVSTHEQAILPFMDSVVNLYDKESLAA